MSSPHDNKARDELKQKYITDFSELELDIAEEMKIELPDPNASMLDAGGCLCKRILRTEGRACMNHSEGVFRVFAMRDFVLAYTESRVAEALEQVKAVGFNEDCMFCGFKDKRIKELTDNQERRK